MKYDIPLPVLLDTYGNESKRLRATNVTITESLTPLSTATITLPADETLLIRSFVKLYTVNGLAGIFRTRVPEETYQSDTCTIELEHALAEVGDYVINDDLSVDEAANLVAAEIMGYYRGTLWTLGTVQATENIKATLDNANVLNALGDLMNALPDYMMTFDFSTTPWQINIVAKPTTVSAEGRLSRNVESVSIERDDSELCTRVYMDKLPNGFLDGDTIGKYGPVERFITGDEATTAAEAEAIAQKYLELRAEPTITITISAQDLYQITGETLDKIQLGTIYRLSLPDSDTQYEKIVSQLEWLDVYGRPGEVTVTLADEASSLTSIMAGMQLQLTKVTKNTYLLSNAIKGDREQLDIMSRTINLQGEQINLNANNIDLFASEEERAVIAGHSTTFYHEAGVAIAANGVSINALETVTNNITGRVEQAEAELSVQAQQIALKVSKGNVATQLTVEAGNVGITGGNLTVDGYATVQQLNATKADIRNLTTGVTTASRLGAQTISATSALWVGGTQAAWHSIGFVGGSLPAGQFLSNADISLNHFHTFEAVEDNGSVTITLGAVTATQPQPQHFDIASTAYYQAAVAEAYARGVVDGGSAIVLDNIDIEFVDDPVWNANNILQQKVKATAYIQASGDPQQFGSPVEAYRSVMRAYNMGRSSVYLSESWSSGVYTVTANNGESASTAIDGVSLDHTATAGSRIYGYFNVEADGDAVTTRTCDLTSVYNEGKESASIYSVTKPTITLTEAQITGDRSTTLYYKMTSAGATKSYPMYVNVDATAVYGAGVDSVTLSGSWDTSTRTYTVTASNGESVHTTLGTVNVYPRGDSVTLSNYTRTAVDVCGTSHRVPISWSGPKTIVDEDGYVWRNMYYVSSWDTLYEKRTSYYFDDDGTESTYYRGASRQTYYTIPNS